MPKNSSQSECLQIRSWAWCRNLQVIMGMLSTELMWIGQQRHQLRSILYTSHIHSCPRWVHIEYCVRMLPSCGQAKFIRGKTKDVLGPATVSIPLAGPQIIINFLWFSFIMLSRHLSALGCQWGDSESHFLESRSHHTHNTIWCMIEAYPFHFKYRNVLI